jgi:hypothetical protein
MSESSFVYSKVLFDHSSNLYPFASFPQETSTQPPSWLYRMVENHLDATGCSDLGDERTRCLFLRSIVSYDTCFDTDRSNR